MMIYKLNYGLLLIILGLLNASCGVITRQLDSSWSMNKTVYEKAKPLPPLEIFPELAGSNQQGTRQSETQ
jgi:hypothetical protein